MTINTIAIVRVGIIGGWVDALIGVCIILRAHIRLREYVCVYARACVFGLMLLQIVLNNIHHKNLNKNIIICTIIQCSRHIQTEI